MVHGWYLELRCCTVGLYSFRMKELPGLYLRGKTWWFRRQVGGVMKQFSLKTRDLAVAVTKVQEHLANPLVGGNELLADINRFLEEQKRLKAYTEASLNSKGY